MRIRVGIFYNGDEEHDAADRQFIRGRRMSDREFRLMQMIEEDKAFSRVMQAKELLLKYNVWRIK